MYLDIIVIDYIYLDGVLQTFRIVPVVSSTSERVIVDRLSDIDRSYKDDREVDIGPFRVYNISNCRITESKSKLRTITIDNDSINFHFEHMYIPVGRSREAHHGYYCLMLPIGFQIEKLSIIDPFDKTETDLDKRKQFRRHIVCDTKTNAISIILELRSGRGSFSFQLYGKIRYVGCLKDYNVYTDMYTEKYWSEGALDSLVVRPPINDPEKIKGHILSEVNKRMEYFELKPNVFGIGLNLNKIIKDLISKIQK